MREWDTWAPTADSMKAFTFAADAPLATIADAYATHGVVVVTGCLPRDTVTDVRAYLRGQLSSVRNTFSRFGLHAPLVDCGAAIGPLLKSGAISKADDRHLFLGHFPLDVRLSPILRHIPMALKAHGILQRLLASSQLFVHMPINARYILPRQSVSAVPTHQDVSYNTHIKDFCVAWTPFSEIDERCCGMAVYPGSHRVGPLALLTGGGDGWLPKIDIGTVTPVSLSPLSPGDVVVFSDTTVHESMLNRSDRIRLNIEARFFARRAHTSKHYLDLQTGEVVNPAAAKERVTS